MRRSYDTDGIASLRHHVAAKATTDMGTDRAVTKSFADLMSPRSSQQIIDMLAPLIGGDTERRRETDLSQGAARLLLCIWDYLHEVGLHEPGSPGVLSWSEVERGEREELAAQIDAIRPMTRGVMRPQSEGSDRLLAALLMRDSRVRLALAGLGEHGLSAETAKMRGSVLALLSGTRSWLAQDYRNIVEGYDAICHPTLTVQEQRDLAAARARVAELERKALQRRG